MNFTCVFYVLATIWHMTFQTRPQNVANIQALRTEYILFLLVLAVALGSYPYHHLTTLLFMWNYFCFAALQLHA